MLVSRGLSVFLETRPVRAGCAKQSSPLVNWHALATSNRFFQIVGPQI
jgi:hypothetical protein